MTNEIDYLNKNHINLTIKNHSKLFVNEFGFYGDFLFEEHTLNEFNKQKYEELDMTKNVPENSTRQYYLLYPTYDYLVSNFTKLKDLNIYYLLRKHQKKEVSFLKEYFEYSYFDINYSDVADFLDFDLDKKELKEKGKFDFRYRLTYIVSYLGENKLLKLNPSYLLNVFTHKKEVQLNPYSNDNLKYLTEDKFPLTKKAISENKEEYYVFSTLFYEIIELENPIDSFFTKLYSDKPIQYVDLSKEEQNEFKRYSPRGYFYVSKEGFIKKVESDDVGERD